MLRVLRPKFLSYRRNGCLLSSTKNTKQASTGDMVVARLSRTLQSGGLRWNGSLDAGQGRLKGRLFGVIE